MRVLVTGAGGHVGGAVARHLAARGFDVAAAVRAPDPSLPNNIPQFLFDLGADFSGDLAPEMRRCAAVVHCAALLSPAPDDDDAMARVNALGTQLLVRLAAQCGARRLVHLSSMSFLGRPAVLPVTEEHPLAPGDPYARSKLHAEQSVTLADTAGLIHGVSLRISSPVGPGLRRQRIFSRFADAADTGQDIVLHGKGGRRQDYVDVRDVARAVECALNGEQRGVVNIASGRAVSNLELAQACVAAFNSPSRITFSGQDDPDEALTWEISIDKARQWWDYAPQFILRQSLLDYRAWRRETRPSS